MLRKFLATIILVVSLEAQVEKFQVIANNVDSKNNIMIATGNVVIFSPTYYITAQKIIYDKNKGTFELFDDVVILKDNNVQTKSEYAFLDVNSDDLYQKPNMFFEEEGAIWINSKDSEKKDDVISLASSIFSSCDCVDPDWSIRMSSADYDTEDKWINTYNARLYVKDIPVLYTPYLGFSTNTERRTGLLMPTIGYSKSEGGTYSQPIYIAPAKNYDIEIIPQFRAKRGAGMYAYIRYADSIDSILKVSGGYFGEKKDYQLENDLRNQEHYGFDIDYKRYNLFANKKGTKDGLFVSINYLNDIEYKTLEDDKYKDDTERYVESKINYIYDTPSYFLGSYFRYYIDTDNDSNAATMQELPKLQAHTYSRPFLLDKLLYSTDIKYTNHTRRDGITANQYEFNLPISYSYSFFDDYIQLIAKHEFSANKFDYGNTDTLLEDATYIESNTTIGLSSDLIKPYEKYIHTMNLSAQYSHSNIIKEDGDLYFDSDSISELSPFPVTRSSDSITLGINQSFYDKENLKQIVNHKLKQSILYDEFDDAKFQNMENEIVYNYILGSVKNKLTYNHQDHKLIESSSSFSLTYDNFSMKLGHYMSKDTPNSGKEDLESYQIDLKYKLSDEYSIGYYTNYNLEEKLRSKQSFIFGITDKCWNLDIKYEKEIIASSTTDGDPTKQDIIYLQLLLKPLGGIQHEYELEQEDVDN
ncbi:LPS-assembly protein LptD [Arcobacter sp. LA11]|uniref:LPS-assembly protein LptD n=1 Tax=Arcobacter sp. LA11 TaxID=1898176 RepID=UPI0009327FD3|nr:LPS-assembly protein LptD [Arcobacter sp. LA11]